MAFFQTPPTLENTYDRDPLLREHIERTIPGDIRKPIEESLRDMGEWSARMHTRATDENRDEPRLVQWDAWGKRIDRIELTPLWKEAARAAAEKGVVATAYDPNYGEYARIFQFALVYLFEPSSHVYSCPLAMTDGALRTLRAAKNDELFRRVLPRLTSRDPATAWTSGQWMTERTGGSDVGTSEAIAHREGAVWKISGTKWFTSAAQSEVALTLARPDGNPPGGRGLALFFVDVRRADGTLNGITIARLKDKLGTRMLPTAELILDGTIAVPVKGLDNGVKNIAPMLTTTRTWNSVAGIAGARRLLSLALDFAKKRVAFGAPLSEKPLHIDTLAGVAAELEAAFLLTFRCAELMGREEHGTLTLEETALFRLLVPIAKLTTGKQVVAIANEVAEAFAGAGYIEDTGIPRLVRDAQVLTIWEGTTNVLSLDVLRVLSKGGSLAPIHREIDRCVAGAKDATLKEAGAVAKRAFGHAEEWIGAALGESRAAVEAGARRFALTLGRAVQLALLVDHAQWSLDRGVGRSAAAARRFAHSPIDLVDDGIDGRDAKMLLA